MEKTYSCECHGNAVLVAAVNYDVVTYGAARFNYIRNTASSCTLYVVVKREKLRPSRAIHRETVRAKPFFSFVRVRASVKCLQHHRRLRLIVVGDVYINGVISVGSADGLYKVESENLRMLS